MAPIPHQGLHSPSPSLNLQMIPVRGIRHSCPILQMMNLSLCYKYNLKFLPDSTMGRVGCISEQISMINILQCQLSISNSDQKSKSHFISLTALTYLASAQHTISPPNRLFLGHCTPTSSLSSPFPPKSHSPLPHLTPSISNISSTVPSLYNINKQSFKHGPIVSTQRNIPATRHHPFLIPPTRHYHILPQGLRNIQRCNKSSIKSTEGTEWHSISRNRYGGFIPLDYMASARAIPCSCILPGSAGLSSFPLVSV